MEQYLIFALIMGIVTFFGTYSKEMSTGSIRITFIVMLLTYFISWKITPTIGWQYPFIWAMSAIVGVVIVINQVIMSDEYDMTRFEIFRGLTPIVTTFVLILFLSISSAQCTRTDEYKNLLNLEVVSDTAQTNISPISLENIMVVDYREANLLATPLLEQIPSLGSKAYIGEFTRQKVNGSFEVHTAQNEIVNLDFFNTICWVAPIEHSGYWKWSKFKTTPGYILVDAVKARAYFVTKVGRKEINLKYLQSSCFGENLPRFLRKNGYAEKGLMDLSFEIDDSGNPFHVITVYGKAIGWSAKKVEGVVVVDPVNGEIKEYTPENAPEWIDRIYPEEVIQSYIGYLGDLVNGYFNWSNDGKFKTTGSNAVIDSKGDTYFYHGLQSVGSDAGTNGFILTNTRTGEAKRYTSTGITEYKAAALATSIEWVAQTGGKYFPSGMILPYNIKGELTYLVILKDANTSARVGFAFVNVLNMTIGEGKTLQEAYNSYIMAMMGSDASNLSESSEVEPLTVTVKEIAQEGSTYYFLFEETKDVEFFASSTKIRKIKWVDEGDKIAIIVNIGEGETQVPIMAIE